MANVCQIDSRTRRPAIHTTVDREERYDNGAFRQTLYCLITNLARLSSNLRPMSPQTRNIGGNGSGTKTSQRLVDSDVHAGINSIDELLPYLPELWRRYLPESGFIFAANLCAGLGRPAATSPDGEVQTHTPPAHRALTGELSRNGSPRNGSVPGTPAGRWRDPRW